MRRRAFLRTGVGAVGALGVLSSPALACATHDHAAALGAGVTDDDLLESDPPADSYEPLGALALEGAAEAVVGDDGETVYVATYDGFATVDVRDPAAPTLLADERDLLAETGYDPVTEILDVKVSGDRLAVVGPANPASADEFHGLLVYDVADPADPTLVGDPSEIGVHLHNCFLADDLCYLVTNPGGDGVDGPNELVICDVSGETEVVGRWSLLEIDERWGDVHWLLWYLHDVFVHEDLAVLAHWNAGTVLLDVSDPTAPAVLAQVDPVDVDDLLAVGPGEITETQQTLPGNDHYSAVDDTGGLLAIGRESWAADAGDPDGAGGIDLYDVTDPTDPVYRSTVEPPETPDASYNAGLWTTAHNFELRDETLVASWYRGGVTVHDVSDPGQPLERASWRDPDTAAFWTARVAGAETFVASSTPLVPNAPAVGGLYVFPIEDGTQADQPSMADAQTGVEFGGETDDASSGTDDSRSDSPAPDHGNANASTGAGDGGGADAVPGFTAGAGVAGGALALEWQRRRRAADDQGR
ncbi:LVIVD repeat-containing protein [Natronobiforma cellulositropha]|uniref:LVIVD repeat-containing protein n=1 Tax=Natronobiforma cellulositropha TaxID=1679076 RepID=UPI0021D5EEF1|nr:hypothetical protein [Natronobiforma cellulositropha]